MRYRKKPVVVEAIQWNGENIDELKDFVDEDCLECDIVEKAVIDGKEYKKILVKINTLEGIMVASDGDFIIKGVNGEFYPCKPDVFRQTYERLKDGKLNEGSRNHNL